MLDSIYMKIVFAIAVVTIAIFYRKKFAKEIVEFQNSRFGIKFSEKDVKQTENTIVFVAIATVALIVYGLLG